MKKLPIIDNTAGRWENLENEIITRVLKVMNIKLISSTSSDILFLLFLLQLQG